jgi:hypothetical protein
VATDSTPFQTRFNLSHEHAIRKNFAWSRLPPLIPSGQICQESTDKVMNSGSEMPMWCSPLLPVNLGNAADPTQIEHFSACADHTPKPTDDIMNFMRNKLRNRGGHRGTGRGGENGPHLTIPPGDVEEAVHYMQFTGEIDLSELTFTAESGGTGIESFLDVVVFEVPPHCTSHNCDLSRYGIGALTHFNGMEFLGLCQAGRLIIDNNIFQGFHTQLMIPSEGPMPSNIKKNSGTFKVPVPDKNFNVMLANCNDNGRPVSLTGQVVFDFEENFTPITPYSLTLLTSVALFVCLCFSCLSIKIDRGTRADWEYQRFQNVEILLEEQARGRLQQQQQQQPSENNADETDVESSEQQELRPASIA